jgi:tRNA dimethylallyltransferase
LPERLLILLYLSKVSLEQTVLIAGPTASGKSALALEIAEAQGGTVVNADASQVFDGWRVLTARPSLEDESRAPHALYGHVPFEADYSAGAWLRDVAPLLEGPERLIIVGGTGLYFMALTEGLAEIPPTPAEVRAEADGLRTNGALDAMIADLDAATQAKIDLKNPMRVQRAWEVQRTTGEGLADWQARTPAPLVPLRDCAAFVQVADPDWLNARIDLRFDLMMEGGALDEVRANAHRFDPALLSCKAIGAPELTAAVRGEVALDEAVRAAQLATRQFAKRQRTWLRKRMRDWTQIALPKTAGDG